MENYKNLLREWENRRKEITALRLSGIKQADIARKFKLSRSRVNQIIKRQIYGNDK